MDSGANCQDLSRSSAADYPTVGKYLNLSVPWSSVLKVRKLIDLTSEGCFEN